MNHIEQTPAGKVWHTTCTKCATAQKVNIGHLTLAEARDAVARIDSTPMECPGGFHTEIGGWEKRWHLDEMLTELAKLEPAEEAETGRQGDLETRRQGEGETVIEATVIESTESTPSTPSTPSIQSTPSTESTEPTADTPPSRYTSPIQLKTIADTGKNGRVTAAINIRAELAHHFPGIKFSVKGDSFSMGDSIDVSWDNGPADKEVDAIIDRYQCCDFDGSDDSTHYRTGESRKFTEKYGDAKYVNGHRTITADINNATCYYICSVLGIDPGVSGPDQPGNYDTLRHDGLNERIKTIAYRILHRTSFPPGATGADITGLARTDENAGIFEQQYTIIMPRFNALNPSASETKHAMTPKLALRLLCQPHECQVGPMGDHNAEFRRDILETLTGKRPPKAKAGIGVVGNALAEFYGITTYTCGADKDEQIRDGLRRTLFQLFSTHPPEFQTELRKISALGGESIEKVYAFWKVYQSTHGDRSNIPEFRQWKAYDLGLESCGTKPRERHTPSAPQPAAPKPQAPKPASRIPHPASRIPTATPLGDTIRRIPAATFAAMSGRNGEAERTAFAAWVDAGSRTGDWRTLYKQYTATLAAPAAEPVAPAAPAPAPVEQPRPWAHWKTGTNVQFTPSAPMGRVVTGTLMELVNGGDGANIFCPAEGDPHRVLRVWARDGALTEAPAAEVHHVHEVHPVHPEPPPSNIIAFPTNDEAKARMQQALERLRAGAQRK